MDGRQVGSTEKLDGVFDSLNGAHNDRGKVKFHAHLSLGDLEAWARFTQGGTNLDSVRDRGRQGLTYTQTTVYLGYNWEIDDTFSIKPSFSFDTLTNQSSEDVSLLKQFRENEYHSKIIATWTPIESHSVAVGGEWSHEQFGRDYKGKAISNQPFFWHFSPTEGGEMPRWDTDHQSIFGEYQWNINDQWTTFAGGRLDCHDFTEHAPSYRGVIVYTPTDQDAIKLIGSRSSRINTAAEMVMDHLLFGAESDTEQLDAYEVRYERHHDDKLFLGGSVFFHDHDVVDHIGGDVGTSPAGNVESWGLEGEFSYKGEVFRLDVSHSYTKLLDMELMPGVNSTFISSEPFGFGDDFSYFHNHGTKIFSEYRLNDKWTTNGTLTILWGAPGGRERARMNGDLGNDTAYDAKAFLRLGLLYRVNDRTSFQFHGHNLLGWIDDDFNARWNGFNDGSTGQYRIQPVAFSLGLSHRF